MKKQIPIISNTFALNNYEEFIKYNINNKYIKK